MRHIRKTLALFLALCFLAVLPLTAAEENEYTDLIGGFWNVYQFYFAESNTVEPMDGMYLVLGTDGTGVIAVGENAYSGIWIYEETSENGHWFSFVFDMDGIEQGVPLLYSTQAPFEGELVLILDDIGMAFYRKTDIPDVSELPEIQE